ncbi:MAG: bifunctional oligoribonuclease/PAP phosphatase NrnA, partial [Candidatus Marinimicrobia bacterium]|nr:bifunctional oligoribonuclease/PAP phosphatase NrnA [Candidatus Neomarinimicrobiota bacterium]
GMEKISQWREFNQRCHYVTTIIITTLLNPDWDAIGSELTMADHLQKLGKKVTILNPSPIPTSLRFLDENNTINTFVKDIHSQDIEHADLVIFLDIGDFDRAGHIGHLARDTGKNIISIDHHPQASHERYLLFIEDTHASSTGYMIYDYLKNFYPTHLNAFTAKALYVAVMTDTGNFRFSNTRAEDHWMAGDLMTYGIEPYKMYCQIYEQFSLPRMELLGYVLQNLHVECEGKLVWFVITKDVYKKYKVTQEDLDGFSDFMRSIAGVEVSVMFKEMEDGTCRVNLRSKGRVVINKVAQHFGGGGHPFASGATLKKGIDDAIPAILNEVKRVIEAT